MDFTSELSAFQGVLVSADNVHSFARLKSRGGNEDQIKYIVKSVFKFLERGKYVTKDHLEPGKVEKVRKFAFYIILNTEFSALQDMVYNEGINSVIWTIPTISQCLMSEMLLHLHMQKFIQEAIYFCYPELSVELASALIDHIKYFSPQEIIPELTILASACYVMICRLNFFTFEPCQSEGLATSNLDRLLQAMFTNFQKTINYFTELPNLGRLTSKPPDEQYKFQGNRLDHILTLVEDCVNIYTGLQVSRPIDILDLYQLTYKEGTFKSDHPNFIVCNSPNKSILECLDKCNEILLDKTKDLVMDVSVDIFCAWSEFEEYGKSMQQTIGEFCHKIRNKLRTVETLSEHPVVSMLKQISRKPVDVYDLARVADPETILEHIRRDGNLYEWLPALLKKDRLLFEVKLIEIFSLNIDALTENDCEILYYTCRAHLEKYTENAELVKSLAIKAYHMCTLPIKNSVLQTTFTDKCFNDNMETAEFSDMLTEIFNKVISEDNAKVTDILTVFLQNPQKVYTKIFNLSAESSQQTSLMLKAMKVIEKFSNHYYNHDTEPCVVRVAETVLDKSLRQESMQENLIKFITGLKSAKIIPENKLLLLIVMPKIHKALIDKDVNQIKFQCKILSEVFSLAELIPYRAPMLAMIAQILGVVRWKITTFTPEAPEALQLALDLQIKLFQSFDGIIPLKEESWLKERLHRMNPLNCYYYRQLWNPPGDNFVEIVSGTPVSALMDTDNLVSWLSQVLSSTTQLEWQEIWESLCIFNDSKRLTMMHDAVLLLTAAEAVNRDTVHGRTWDCVLNCYKNFVYIARYKYFKEPLTNEQVSEMLDAITTTANLSKPETTLAVATVFMPLFVYLVNRKDDFTINVPNVLSDKLHNQEFKELVLRMFVNDGN